MLCRPQDDGDAININTNKNIRQVC
ncbi:DUF5445 family protein [Escherichia coli]